MADATPDSTKRDHSAADTARTLHESIDDASEVKDGSIQLVSDVSAARPEVASTIPTPPTAAVVDGEKTHDGDPADGTTSQDAVEYPTGGKLFLINLSLCLSIFLTALDNTIIATVGYRCSECANTGPWLTVE